MRVLFAILLVQVCAWRAVGQAWQIDIQTAAGGPIGNNPPVTSTYDPDGAGPIGNFWNAYEVAQITADYADPNSTGAKDPPPLLGLKDSLGSVTNVNFDIVGKVEGYNTNINDDDVPVGGFRAAVGDHLFFVQGGADLNLGFVFSGLAPGAYSVTAYSNPNYHVPTRGFTLKVGAVSVDIVPGDFDNAIASAASITGIIADVSVSASGQLEGELRFLTGHGDPSVSAFRLERTSGVHPTGDYNGNGIVDAADYTIWRDTLNQSGPALAADADGNLTVDTFDYGIWKSHFGGAAGAGSPSSIPEPSSVTIVASFMLAAICFGRCRGHISW